MQTFTKYQPFEILREAHVGDLGASTVGGSNIFFAGLQNKPPHKYSRFHNLSDIQMALTCSSIVALGPIPDNRANEVGFDGSKTQSLPCHKWNVRRSLLQPLIGFVVIEQQLGCLGIHNDCQIPVTISVVEQIARGYISTATSRNGLLKDTGLVFHISRIVVT
jgi:hypothetical protein